MMDEEELEELAADIKANGLQQPLVIHELDDEPVLVDGRNRREACRALGIVPDYVLLDGQDSLAYIMSANVHRRHMTKGQRVMIVAKICSETKQTLRQISEQNKVALAAIGRARTVLRHTPDLADQVLTGSLSLDKAYEEARICKGQADTYVDIRTFLSYSGWSEREAICQATESPRCQDHQKTGQRGPRTRRAYRASSADPDARR
jgi:ParB-like nuclease family protein